MHLRIFGDGGWPAAAAFLKRSEGSLQVEVPPPEQWLSGPNIPKADVHIYAVPQRMALGDAAYHVATEATEATGAKGKWVADDYSEPLSVIPSSLRERVAALRNILGRARKAAKAKEAKEAKEAKKATDTETPAAAETYPSVGVVILSTAERFGYWNRNIRDNITRQAYPKAKTYFFLVCDEGLRDVIQEMVPGVIVIDAPVDATIGAKRNMGCAAAVAAGCEILAMMDDDDYYPEKSVANRVAALRSPNAQKAGQSIVFCSSLPIFDARQNTSMMHVIPTTDAPESRCSEASLAFTRAAWLAQQFPISIPNEGKGKGEGYGFLSGRMAETAEIYPIDIIVALVHFGNFAWRRQIMKAEKPTGCIWKFPGEYSQWLVALVQKQAEVLRSKPNTNVTP